MILGICIWKFRGQHHDVITPIWPQIALKTSNFENILIDNGSSRFFRKYSSERLNVQLFRNFSFLGVFDDVITAPYNNEYFRIVLSIAEWPLDWLLNFGRISNLIFSSMNDVIMTSWHWIYPNHTGNIILLGS